MTPETERSVEFSQTCEAVPSSIRSILKDVETAITTSDISVDCRSDILIVLGEVLNNVAEHAYGWKDGGWLTLSVKRAGDRLDIRVEDGGAPMPDGMLPEGKRPSINVARAELPEGGFGWHLIHSLTETLEYERAEDRNILRLTMPARR